jgi:hypothetical protein
MPEGVSLEELVLGYCIQVGGLVEPPAYGIHEVLLPDEIASRWGVEADQRITFNADNNQDGVVYLHYGHPLVETIVNELRLQAANGQFFINQVRPEKPGLFAAAEKTFSLPNAKLFPMANAAEEARLHQYVRFNFKVNLIADEKRELILPVWMDAQNGYTVDGVEIEREALLDTENQSPQIPMAPAYWNHTAPLAPETLAALLERARQSVTGVLGERLAHLQTRLTRYLELDRARLDEYYTDLLQDARRRLQKADGDRLPALESKIAAILSEREAKLADVEQKYHLRIQLELLNLAVITLPKLDLTVEIRKRSVAVQRILSWNPLLHAIDPLACDVCGQAGVALVLCENGHLAHEACLAPQCVDCKRTYCQKCASEVQQCAVCERPVCTHSLVCCPTCQRVTCQEHANECHADAGQPRKVLPQQAVPVTSARRAEEIAPPAQATPPASKTKTMPKRVPPRPKISYAKAVPPKPSADFMEVYADPAARTITAYAIAKKRELAERWWALEENGLASYCHCEKGASCTENGIVYRPADDIEKQIQVLVGKFRDEYGLPESKVRYFQIRQGRPFDEKKLKVPSSWKDPGAIEQARAGFETLRRQ